MTSTAFEIDEDELLKMGSGVVAAGPSAISSNAP
jgi:hypothetical protein